MSIFFRKMGLKGRRAGMALVVTLVLIVLTTVAVMAFFARATSNRLVEATRANQVLVDQVAATGADYVAGQFLQEIAAKSTASTISGTPIYQPSTNTFAIPQRTVPSGLFADTNFPSLIRRSVIESTNGIGETNASADNSASPSKNGRKVGVERWNAPFLNPGSGFTATNQLPNWIYLNRDGTVTPTASTNVIGRFAYVAYDVSGLLDANIAGFPSAVSGTNLATIKSTLAGADLSVIPGISSPKTFIDWRNTNSITSGPTYVTAVTNAAQNGFLRPPAGDQRIVSRKDLIKLARTGKYGLSLDALPYLTQFSRAINTPSWTPRFNASQMTNYVASLATSPRNYRDIAETASSVNRNIPNVRVTVPFTRRDGTAASKGDPLIKQRFPLGKLALVHANPDSATADEVLKYFGLTWNGNPTEPGWEYRSLTINTLAQVAAAGREPDFFELLKAGILDGSLGKSTRGDANIRNTGPDRNVDLQILTIGANLIDQADADDTPTIIRRADKREIVIGIENHPYIQFLSQTHFRRKDRDFTPPLDLDGPGPGNPWPWVAAYQQIQIWNPHFNAAATGRSYRILALQGVTHSRVRGTSSYPVPPPTGVNGVTGPAVNQKGRFIAFNGSTSFSEPTLLTPVNISDCSPGNKIQVMGASLAGFWLGDAFAANNIDGDDIQKNDFSGDANDATYSFDEDIIYQLEYLDGGSWVPVQRMYPLFGSNGQSQGMSPIDNPPGGGNYFWKDISEPIWNGKQAMGLVYCKTDPRSQRFGFYTGGYGDKLNNSTMRRSWSPTNHGYAAWGGGNAPDIASQNPGWAVSYPMSYSPSLSGGLNQGYTPDDLSVNRRTSPVYIADPDGVVRPADGNESAATHIPGPPFAGKPSQAREVMLNRPFLSVGEMGYALRGDPWKTLDFASAASADSALLDLFSVSDTPDVQAGVLNPNRAPIQVLQAVLANEEIDPVVANTSLSSTDARTIATSLRTVLAAQPLQNRDELPRKINELPSLPAALVQKRQNEVLVRAFADISNTRTWNVMVDIVAQSGMFLDGPTGPGDFIVQGEQRRWEHLAIDRPTAKVISQSSELCPE